MALTDRQSALMQEKLLPYREQFMNLDWDFRLRSYPITPAVAQY